MAASAVQVDHTVRQLYRYFRNVQGVLNNYKSFEQQLYLHGTICDSVLKPFNMRYTQLMQYISIDYSIAEICTSLVKSGAAKT